MPRAPSKPKPASKPRKPAKRAAAVDQTLAPVVKAFAKDKAVEAKVLFARTGLSVGGKIFAFPWEGGMVVKLPAARVLALIAAREGDVFDRGQGTPMKEWVLIPPATSGAWVKLAKEAREFVGGGKKIREK